MADTLDMKGNGCGAPSASGEAECCCGPRVIGPLTYRQLPLEGEVETPRGPVARLSSRWRGADYLGAILVRFGINRMDYAVKPGLCALGKPSPASPVVVTANYKLTVDVVRRATAGLDLWLLVLDTKGVNVWCAAGKGTFGTMEIARKVMETDLAGIVTGRTLIVPQLGAPGVAAHMVKAFSDFSVVFGPVRAADLAAFLRNGLRATEGMRRVRFNALDRLTVAWLELALALKAGLLVSLAILAVSAFVGRTLSVARIWHDASLFLLLLWSAIVAGTVLTALFLPYLPGRAFSLRGGIMGAVTALLLLAFARPFPAVTTVSLVLSAAAVSAYLALNYTGASTFTSLSGVRIEIRRALPVIASLLAGAAILQIARVFL